MADGTAIEWTDATWNPLRARKTGTGKIGWHCEHVSEGCRNCYAEGINRRLGTRLDFKPGHRSDIQVFLDEKMLTQPLRWKRPRTIFVNSMSDTFADFVKDEWIDRMFAVMALCPQHRFQVLTKRAKRMRAYLSSAERKRMIDGAIWLMLGTPPGSKIHHGGDWKLKGPLPNVWLGVSAEDQANADARIPDLLATPAAVRFVSLEPLLGPIDLTTVRHDCGDGLFGNALYWHHKPYRDERRYPALDWVIVGGESGPQARPMHPDWARKIRDDCAMARVPYFFKQWGAYRFRDLFEDDPPRRVGKKRAGRLLDGREWNEMPA